MEEMLFLQRIARHKEEIDHVTFQHQVSGRQCVCGSVCVYVCVCLCVSGRQCGVSERFYVFFIFDCTAFCR